MNFPKDFPEKLRSSILISEVVGKKVRLKQRGKEFTGLCPFHNEKSPSFTVNNQKGFYHCFGCQAHGDIIAFVMNNEALEYQDAVKKLADDFGIQIPQVKYNPEAETKTETSYRIVAKANEFFEKNLFSNIGEKARNYLKKRGLNSKIVKKFHIGFAPDSYQSLINFLKEEGFNDDEISNCGIVSKSDQNKLYDKLRNRITFAITDKKERIIAFGGRTIADDIPKYLNSAETEIFKKNQTIYNYALARKSIFSKGFAVIVEGYMDTIALASNGIENVVAGLGTAISSEHITQLFYITDKIVVCLDGDSAGIKASKRIAEIALPLITSKKNLGFTILPNQMDPDDFIKNYGAEELKKIFLEAKSLSYFLFECAFSDLEIKKKQRYSPEEKAKIEAYLSEKANLIKDPAYKKYFNLFFKDNLYNLGRKSYKNNSTDNKILSNIPPFSSQNEAEKLSLHILAFLIKFPDLANFHENDFDIREMNFIEEKISNLKDFIIDLIDQNQNIFEELEKSDFSFYVSQIKNLVNKIMFSDFVVIKQRFHILLMKNLLLQVESQYKKSLSEIDEIETRQTEISNQKIKKIFDYKNSLQTRIIELEKEFL